MAELTTGRTDGDVARTGSRGSRLLAAAVLCLGTLGACGSDDGGGEAATSGDGSSSTTTGADETTAADDRPLSVLDVAGADDVDLPYSDVDLFSRSEDGLLFLDDELLFVGLLDGEVVARDITETVTGGDGEVAPMLFPVTLCDDGVVVASVERDGGDDGLVAVDVASGDQLWTARVGDDGISPLACAGGVVVANGEDEVVGLDVADGEVAWTAPLEPDDPPYAGGDLAVIGTYDGVVGLDVATGEERWRVGESSDRVASVQTQGAIVELSDGFVVLAPDGEVLGELPEDVRDLFRDGSNVYVEEMLLAGPDDDPVVVVNGGAGWVSMDGELTVPAADSDGEIVTVGGAAGELIWVSREFDSQDERRGTTPIDLVDTDGEVVEQVVVDALVGVVAATTDLALLDDPIAVVGS